VAADDATGAGILAKSARDELLHSESAKMVLTGLTTLTRAGRSLSAHHQLPGAFAEFCSSLLVRAKTFYPETKQSCDASAPEKDEVVPLLSVDSKVLQAKLTKKVVPIYPAEAKTLRVSGTVLLSVIVNETGDVVDLGFTSGPFLLYHSALAAVRDWKYSPTQIGGKPVEISTVVTVHYTLSS
jgi:TonB family protein